MNTDFKILNKISANSNPTTHKKDRKPQPSETHPKFTRMVQHMQISQCDTPDQQKKRQNLLHNHLNRYRKHSIKFNIHSQ